MREPQKHHTELKKPDTWDFSLFSVVTFYKVAANTKLANIKPQLPGKNRVRFLWAFGHIFVNQSIHNLPELHT